MVDRPVIARPTFSPVKYPAGSSGASRTEPPSLGNGFFLDVPDSRKLTTLGLPASRWTPYRASFPTLLVPYEIDANPAVTAVQTFVSPVQPGPYQTVNDGGIVALKGYRGKAYIPSDGVWYIRPFVSVGVTETVYYFAVDVTDRDLLNMLLRAETQEVTGVLGDVVLAAAVGDTLFELADSYRMTWLRLVNTGANGGRIAFGPAAASAANGAPIGAAATVTSELFFRRGELPLARCTAFSTLGTTLAVTFGRS